MSKKRTYRTKADTGYTTEQPGVDQAPDFLDGHDLNARQRADFLNALGTVAEPKEGSHHLDQYRHFLDDMDMTEERKTEYLEYLWNVVCNFVDLGYGTHPVQLALAAKRKDDPSDR